MRLLIFFSLFLYHSTLFYSQNLTVNGSFEDIKKCPKRVSFKFKKLKTKVVKGTPDYYNTCRVEALSIPYNNAGFQQAQNGKAYCGIILTTQQVSECEKREYIQLKLSESLKNGYKYSVSFHVNLANFSGYYTDQIGIYMSKEDLSKKKTIKDLLGRQQITNPLGSFLNDTTNWIEIKGIYNAIGGEKYITVGNFQFCNKTSRKALISNDKKGVLKNLKNKNRGKIVQQMSGNKKSLPKSLLKEMEKHSMLLALNDMAYYLIDNVQVKELNQNKQFTYLENKKACIITPNKLSESIIIDGGFDLNKTSSASWKNASGATPDFEKGTTGIYLYSAINKNNREFIYTHLKEKINPCSNYYFEMKVKRNPLYKYAVDQIGICLTDSFKVQKGRDILPYPPIYLSPKFHLIDNPNEWITLCTEISPKNCSKTIVIGNFSNDEETIVYDSEKSTGGGPFAYYFIDDVVLVETSKIEGCNNPCNNSLINDLPIKKDSIAFTTTTLKYKSASYKISLKELLKLSGIMKEVIDNNSKALFLIKGYTDNVGTNKSNLNLSKKRAVTVYEFLIQSGVSEKNLNFLYFGSNKPKTSNQTKKGRAINRRVDILRVN